MPLYRHGDTVVFFVHIPKTGGTTIEAALRSAGAAEALRFPGKRDFSKATLQHLHAEVHEEAIGRDFFDWAFTVVRNPYMRFASEYKMKVVDAGGSTSLDEFAERNFERFHDFPYTRDNHIRPQHEFLAPHVERFHFEGGVEAPIRVAIERLGLEMPEIPHAKKGSTGRLPASRFALRAIAEFYAADFERFGYDTEDYGTAFELVPSQAAPPVGSSFRSGNARRTAPDEAATPDLTSAPDEDDNPIARAANLVRRLARAAAWRARRLRNRVVRNGLGAPATRVRSAGPHAEPPEPTPGEEVVYSVGFGRNGEAVYTTLRNRFEGGMMLGGSHRETVRVLHVAVEEVRPLLESVLEHCRGVDVLIRRRGRWRQPLTSRSIDRIAAERQSFELLVVEDRVGPETRHVRCSCIEVASWVEHLGPDERAYRETHSAFEIVRRLRPETFETMIAARHDFDTDVSTTARPPFEIDVVYTWVDGDDPAWQRAKAERSGQDGVPERSLRDERFRSRDELKYSLRSIEQFAPWVRKIHIVTADQCPPWLDTDHPQINLVSHRDIYRDPRWLPTFNSSGIETQLHHIPDLAQRFLYFNDDFFLGQLCDPADFFHSNGVLKYFPTELRAYEADIDDRSEEYVQADRNAIELLKHDFPAVGRAIMRHVPYPSDRDLLAELEERYQREFDRCAASPFRSGVDLRPIAFMQYHAAYQQQLAMPSSITHRYLALWKPNIVEQLAGVRSTRQYKTFCINDVGLQPERLGAIDEAVSDFLEAYFPVASQFERTNP